MTNESIFNKVKEDMIENKGFSISRVPKNVREAFLQYARDEWADDRGMALSHIFKFFMGECSSGHEGINTKLDYLAEEISTLKSKLETKEEKKQLKRLDGKIPGEKKNE